MEPRAIQVLPDHVIDQIAAGEVVERPASVVKELVENSLDSGARQVVVEIERGGRELIRVLDDGSGMTGPEARLALVRHATSKLRGLDDLSSLATMGFRGEALPSIAAVSRMVLTTRARGASDAPGTRLVVEAGQVMVEEAAGSPAGTLIEVRDLLFNLPARLKFMKGEATESAHVSEAMARLAMAHPGVHFRLRSRGRTVLDAPPHGDGYERACAVLGERLGGAMHRSASREGRIGVEVFLGAPELAQTTTRAMHLYVGRRWVRDRGLVHAVLRGYGELVPRGRYPAAVVFLDIEGPDVDVNVHPQKLEVRFADSQAVYAAVRHAVRDAVARAPWLGEPASAYTVALRTGDQPGRASEMAREYASSLSRSLFSWRRPEDPLERPQASDLRPPVGPQTSGLGPPVGPQTSGLGPSVGPQASGLRPQPDPNPSPSPNPDRAVPSDTLLTSLRYLGQLDRTYLVCEREGELVLVDQHAAHERVAFERLRQRQRSRSLPRQQLLFPQTIGLDRGQAAVARDSQSALESIGFEIEPFGDAPGGGCAFAVKSVPSGLRPGEDPIALLVELIDELAEQGGSRALDERLDAVLATLACHSVVRAGDELSAPEVEALLTSLAAVEFRAHCPHGRPVLLRLRVDEIARRFGRT
ncbi:MAG TPA: DNA mismatch repair endonuclease MutL [Kofleriaceae bacterium]|nr:DNA mismatch repair endonuclease MutL [Kofleriaceae bacterium]